MLNFFLYSKELSLKFTTKHDMIIGYKKKSEYLISSEQTMEEL